jgi:hypothetical protein
MHYLPGIKGGALPCDLAISTAAWEKETADRSPSISAPDPCRASIHLLRNVKDWNVLYCTYLYGACIVSLLGEADTWCRNEAAQAQISGVRAPCFTCKSNLTLLLAQLRPQIDSQCLA